MKNFVNVSGFRINMDKLNDYTDFEDDFKKEYKVIFHYESGAIREVSLGSRNRLKAVMASLDKLFSETLL